tara:strand:- start:413 stop:799 length:387 start_codon:yes stop_codon:yes gene_type:complete
MGNNVRFVDSLKVGAYTIAPTGNSIEITNNVNNYVLTATGNNDKIQGESEFIFDGVNLGIGGAPGGTSRLEIYSTGSVDNLLLIKSMDTNAGIKIDNKGLFQLLEFTNLPTPVEGGLAYSGSGFYVGE